MTEKKKTYKVEYETLGDERSQQGIPLHFANHSSLTKKQRRRARTRSHDATISHDQAFENFWARRSDLEWTEQPVRTAFRNGKHYVYSLVSKILVDLAPEKLFNPHMLKSQFETKVKNCVVKLEEGKTAHVKTKTMIRVANTKSKGEEKEESDIARIRNNKHQLQSLVGELKTRRGHEILLIEILAHALSAESPNLPEALDSLWAIERLGEMSNVNSTLDASALMHGIHKDKVELVYDRCSSGAVAAVLEKARRKRAAIADIIRFQLDEMSDRLPPLSKYDILLTLDPWQLQALGFMDAGKSAIICAPTSSGKTVLSAYLALIGHNKRHAFATAEASAETEKRSGGGGRAVPANLDSEPALADDAEEVEESDSDDNRNFDDYEDEEWGSVDAPVSVEERPETTVPARVEVEREKPLEEVEREKRTALRLGRLKLRTDNSDGQQRVLFVVPTEPLVWQVAANFSKLLQKEGDTDTKVAIVTNQITYHPMNVPGVMPNIVVGTPCALESALTKSRGLIGKMETRGATQKNILPGGFDHFDWVIYDEVHALDGEEGDALQRLIRSMSCKFLALSATVGNGEELRGWMERVKGDQLLGVEVIDVLPTESSLYGRREGPMCGEELPAAAAAAAAASGGEAKKRTGKRDAGLAGCPVHVTVRRLSDGACIVSTDLDAAGLPNKQAQFVSSSTVDQLRQWVWSSPLFDRNMRSSAPASVLLTCAGQPLTETTKSLDALVSDDCRGGGARMAVCSAESIDPFSASLVGSISHTTMTVEQVLSGAVHLGLVVSGGGIKLGTIVLTQISGVPNGVGEYTVSVCQEKAAGPIAGRGVPILVRAFDGKLVAVRVLLCHTLAMLKKALHEELDIAVPVVHQRLLLAGRLLDAEDSSLLDLGVCKDCTLHLALPLVVDLVTFDVQVMRTLDNQSVVLRDVSPLATVGALQHRVSSGWHSSRGGGGKGEDCRDGTEPTLGLASGIQLLHVLPLPTVPAMRISVATAAMVTCAEIEIAGDVSMAVTHGSVLMIGDVDGARQVLSVMATSVQTETTRVRVREIAAGFPAGTTVRVVTTKDLAEHNHNAILADCGLGGDIAGGQRQGPPAPLPVICMHALVNHIQHQVRFINLQRFLWKNKKLVAVSPLAALDSAASVAAGALDNSSLSFTSRDSYRLWAEMEIIYPAEAVRQFNPTNFFPADQRITLMKTKEYEDLLKRGLKSLATAFPLETEELLLKFSLEDADEEVDLCEMVRSLSAADMLPGLLFHLNAFEAIKIFQRLLGGLEARQKEAFPTYYGEQELGAALTEKGNAAAIKCFGNKPKKEAKEEMQMAGLMDGVSKPNPHHPHPLFVLGKMPMTEAEFLDLSADMEVYDGFERRAAAARKEQRGENQGILTHALLRGLRRGIGLYINEISFPAYRRAVQRLASQGKLAVVISDDSLAFGVNMPFRTCVFCGEMGGQLSPLMAQQMAGRAGRRGLDTQGNLVYAGARARFVRELMIGTIANITGSKHRPRYDTMFLQGMLSNRHVGWSRMETLSGRDLHEFTAGVPPSAAGGGGGWAASRSALRDLRLIEFHGPPGQEADLSLWGPRSYSIGVDAAMKSSSSSSSSSSVVAAPVVHRIPPTWEQLAMVWELRGCVPESVCIGRLLPFLFAHMTQKLVEFRHSRKKGQAAAVAAGGGGAKSSAADKLSPLVPFFFSIFLQLVDRQQHDPATSVGPSLQDLPHFAADRPADRAALLYWGELFAKGEAGIPDHLAHLRSPVPPGSPLDSALFQFVLNRRFADDLPVAKKRELKARIMRVGNVLRVMHNTLWPSGALCEALEGILRTCFRHLYYLNTELVRAQVNFQNVSDVSFEARVVGAGVASQHHPSAAVPDRRTKPSQTGGADGGPAFVRVGAEVGVAVAAATALLWVEQATQP